MSTIRIRPASRTDDAFFREMELDTTWSSLTPEERAELSLEEVRLRLEETLELLLKRDGNRIFIAEREDGERLGLLWYGVNRNLVTGEDEAWVYNVTVLSAHQGGGVGRRLMEHAERLAKDEGFRTLGLMVSAHNQAARRLYDRMRFRATNLVMRKRL